MSRPWDAGAPLVVDLGAPVEATPGQPASLSIRLRHTASRELAFAVSFVGLDPAWGAAPTRSLPVAPDADATVYVAITPPAGTPAGRYPFLVVAQPLDPVTGATVGDGVHVDGLVVVGDTSELTVTVVPAEPRGVRRRRIVVDLDNAGTTPVSVELAATTSTGLRVRLRSATPTVPPGQTTRVRARLTVDRPRLFGQVRRIPFVLTAQGRTTPLRHDGVFVARPLFGRIATRALALVVVVALWAAVAVVGVGKSSSRAHQKDNVSQLASSQTTAPSGTASPGAGSGGAGESGGAGGSGGSNGSGSGSAANAAASTGLERVNGTVTGAAPGGVTVTLAPTSLVDEAAQGATFVGVSAPSGPVGKISTALVSFKKPTSVASTTLSTVTQTDGSWAFAGIHAPGYYLLTFSKAGYQTKRYVISPTVGTDPTPLTVPLAAGNGHLSGAVTGPAGALGGVGITITDGTVTVATTTPTSGDVGHWSVDGMSTPGTYLVSASRAGFGTESTLVTLPAGGSLDAVDLALSAGVESLVGTVTAPDDAGVVAGIGGVTVSATNGTVTRTATTVTTGPVGHYTLPNLPVPSTYTVTVSGAGYATRTARVDLSGAAPDQTVDAQLSASTATVTGTVTTSNGAGLVGAGIVLSGDNATYKTTTVSDPAGGFRITGVTPGSYVLAAEKFGQLTQYASVDVTMGAPVSVTMALPTASGDGLPATSHVRGRVTDSRTGGQITCPPNIPSGDCVITATTTDRAGGGTQTFQVTAPPDQEYLLPAVGGAGSGGLLPGLHAVTVSAPGYEATTVMVQVPLGVTIEAPPVALAPAAVITGSVSTPVGALPAGTCVIVVPLAEGGSTAPPCTPAAPPALTCTTTIGDALCAVADSNGHYEIDSVPHGSYDVYVEPTDTEYLPAPPVPETVASGEVRTYDASIHRLGRLAVTVLKPDANGTPVAAAGETVTISPGTTPAATTDSGGLATLTGLAAGVYNALAVDSGNPLLKGNMVVSVGLDQTISTTVVLTEQVGTVRGRLVYKVDNAAQPVAGASIVLTGVAGYFGTFPIKFAGLVTTDSNGCFAITPTGTPPPASGGSGPCDGAGLPTAPLPLLTPNVDVSVDATAVGLGTSNQTGLSISGGALTVVMAAPARAVSGALGINPTPPGAVDLSQASVQVISQAVGSGNLTFAVDTAGNITWRDSAVGSAPNQAVPGTYKLRATMPGYDDAVATVFVPASTDGSTFSYNLTLTPFGALTINAVDSSSAPVTGAVFILSATGVPATTLNAPPGGSSVTFSNLSPSVGDYHVEVRAGGYAFTDSGPLTVSPGVTSSDDVTLAREGAIVGTVSGSVSGQTFTLTGMTVTATKGADTFTAVTDIHGKYRITGSTTTQGLDAGAWTVSVTSAGYNSGNPVTATATVPAGGGDVTQDLTLPADPVTFTVNVKSEGTPSKPVTNATVTLENGGGSLSPSSSSGGGYTFTNVPPTQYSLQIVASGFAPLNVSVTLSPGQAGQSLFVTLASRTDSVEGVVKGQRGSDAAVALAGATVQAFDSDSDPIGSPVTTGADGSYAVTGLPDGATKIEISDTGYATQSRSFTLKNGQVAEYDVTLVFFNHQLTVNVTSQSGVSMDGAQVTLTADPASTGQDQAAQPVVAGKTVFNQVLAGKYTITTTGPAGHLGGSKVVTLPNDSSNQSTTVSVAELELRLSVDGDPVNPAGNVTITLNPAPSGGQPAPIAADGAEHTVFVPIASYTVKASAPGYVDASKPATPPGSGNQVVTVALTLQQEGSMTVTVTDSSSAPVQGVTVTLSGGPSSPTPATTNASGVATFSNLAPGGYDVDATNGTLNGSASSQTVTAGQDTAVPITVS